MTPLLLAATGWGDIGALVALGIAFAFSILVLALHLAWLGKVRERANWKKSRIGRLWVHSEIILAHLVAGFIYVFAFYIGLWLDLGSFEHDTPVRFVDIYTFSMINVTTLGLGDILVSDHLRQIAGVQSLTGFLLLSCSAQLVWQTMKEEEDLDGA